MSTAVLIGHHLRYGGEIRLANNIQKVELELREEESTMESQLHYLRRTWNEIRSQVSELVIQAVKLRCEF